MKDIIEGFEVIKCEHCGYYYDNFTSMNFEIGKDHVSFLVGREKASEMMHKTKFIYYNDSNVICPICSELVTRT